MDATNEIDALKQRAAARNIPVTASDADLQAWMDAGCPQFSIETAKAVVKRFHDIDGDASGAKKKYGAPAVLSAITRRLAVGDIVPVISAVRGEVEVTRCRVVAVCRGVGYRVADDETDGTAVAAVRYLIEEVR